MNLELDARSLPGLDRGFAALRLEFQGQLPDQTIDQVLNQALSRFSSARIPVYVPILVVRFARDRLGEMSRTDGGETRSGDRGSVALAEIRTL